MTEPVDLMPPTDETSQAALAAGPGAALAAGSGGTGFAFYIFMHGCWFVVLGVQIVLFPYLVRVLLQQSEVRLGLAQAAFQVPTTLLILIGGFVADRLCAKRLMITLYAACTLPFLLLGLMVAMGALTYGMIIAYAVTIGTLGAFALPARDSLLSRVAPDPNEKGLQHAVSIAGLAQFAGQIFGMAAAATAALTGVVPLLVGQAGLLAAAAISGLSIRPRAQEDRAHRGGEHPVSFMFKEISGGLKSAAAHPLIAPTMILSLATGVFLMGSFMVILPLIVEGYFRAEIARGDHGAIALALSLFSLSFWVGTIISAFIILFGGAPRRKGRGYLLALCVGGLALLTLHFAMPFWALCLTNVLWGLGGGFAMVLSRGIVQAEAPPQARARVLSIYTLGFMGGTPIGAVAFGALSGWLGPHTTIIIPGLGILAVVAGVAAFSQLWQQGRPQTA